VGHHLGELILSDPEIQSALPVIRSFYCDFFDLHEIHLAREILKAEDPWEILESFPLYTRYQGLVLNQVDAFHSPDVKRLAFLGCGPVPLTLILLGRFHQIDSIGVDTNPEAVSLARQCIKRLELEETVQILHGDERSLSDLPWDTVLVGALVEPKQRIFRNLRP